MTKIFIEISPGELVDRTTILRLKSARVMDPLKLAVVQEELARHEDLVEAFLNDGAPLALNTGALHALMERLFSINARLWEIENDIRACEHGQNFGAVFIELARAVYRTNDERFATKREIDRLLGSEISEVKSYGDAGSCDTIVKQA
jgi:hypothetical protein